MLFRGRFRLSQCEQNRFLFGCLLSRSLVSEIDYGANDSFLVSHYFVIFQEIFGILRSGKMFYKLPFDVDSINETFLLHSCFTSISFPHLHWITYSRGQCGQSREKWTLPQLEQRIFGFLQSAVNTDDFISVFFNLSSTIISVIRHYPVAVHATDAVQFFRSWKFLFAQFNHLECCLLFAIVAEGFFHCGFFAVPSFAAEIAFFKRVLVNVQFALVVDCDFYWFAHSFCVCGFAAVWAAFPS